MPSSTSSLRERWGDDLRSGSVPVLLTAVSLAMLVSAGTAWYWDEFAGGFLLLVTIGVVVPYAHETHCPQDQTPLQDVAWTVVASAVAGGLFAGGYLVAGRFVGETTHAAVLAFVATVLVGEGSLRLLRRLR